MHLCAPLLTAVALGFPAQADDTRKRYAELGGQLTYFPPTPSPTGAAASRMSVSRRT
jgi:hypothetical protein